MTNDRPADLILSGATVHAGVGAGTDASPGPADHVAISAGRISAVGTATEARAHAGPNTEVLDVRGAMVVPGFQDAHVHPPHGGLAELRCELHELLDADAYLAAVAGYAAANPSATWILGGGWAMPAFPSGTPRREALDDIVPDRPVFLVNRDGHGAWVNSRALELAGIDAGTPDPSDGRIERDAVGAPTGTLHEGAMDLVGRLAPPATQTDMERALLLAQRRLHAFGVTAWQDAWVTPPDLEAYRALAGRGELTARVVAALWWDRHRGLEQVDDLVAQRERGMVGRLRATSVKIMQDGVCENFTAAVLDPYLDGDGRATENRGISFVDPELLEEAVTRLDALEFQVHFHALADRAVREALDAVEAARRANGLTDTRPHLAHLQVVHPDDLSRFRSLGAVANVQPLWAAHETQMDELTIPFLGEPRWRWQYPFASLVRNGAMLAMGSDWSVSSPNPLEEIHVAVNRVMPPSYPYGANRDEVFLPEERLDLETSIAAFTIGSAFVNHLDRETGSVEVGKLADLAVIDRNVFAHPSEEIAEARCQMTFVEGERVFAAADA